MGIQLVRYTMLLLEGVFIHCCSIRSCLDQQMKKNSNLACAGFELATSRLRGEDVTARLPRPRLIDGSYDVQKAELKLTLNYLICIENYK